MNLGDRIRSGAKWLAFGNIGNQIIQFCVGILLARLLVPEDFGMLVTVQAFTGLAGFVAGGGMGQALVRAKEITEKDFHVVFTMQMAIGCVLYTVFYSIAPYFAHWFGDPLYEYLLRVSATYFLLRPFSNMYNSWLQREMHYKQQSIRRVVLSIFTSILTATAAWAGMGVWSLVLGGLIGTMLSIVVLRAITPYRPQLYFDPTIAKRHSSYGAKIAAIDVITYLKNQAPNIIISRISGAHLVGLFNKADSMAKIPFAAVNGPIYQPVFRSLSIAQDNPDQAKYIFFRTISLLAVYTLPLYIGLAWCSTPLISFLYGEKWTGSSGALEILAISGTLYCIHHPAGAVLAAFNRLGSELVAQICLLIIITVGILLTLSHGLEAVAWILLLGHIYITTHLYYLATRCFPHRLIELFRAIKPGILLNCILIATLATVHTLLPTNFSLTHQGAYLAVTIAAGGMVYGLSFLFLPIKALATESARWRKMLHLGA